MHCRSPWWFPKCWVRWAWRLDRGHLIINRCGIKSVSLSILLTLLSIDAGEHRKTVGFYPRHHFIQKQSGNLHKVQIGLLLEYSGHGWGRASSSNLALTDWIQHKVVAYSHVPLVLHSTDFRFSLSLPTSFNCHACAQAAGSPLKTPGFEFLPQMWFLVSPPFMYSRSTDCWFNSLYCTSGISCTEKANLSECRA